MQYANRIRQRLTQALAPERLDIKDVSHRHAGHAGADPAGETHFDVVIVATAFVGKSRVERQRMVHAALVTEMAERVHALSMRILTPDEAVTLNADM